MELIPAIDIKDGRCVRLYQGDFSRVTVFGDDPVAVARGWYAAGATRLHVVDLDGARQGRPVHTALISAIVAAIPIPVQLGGGLRDAAAVAEALGLGVARAIIGTAAVENPDLVATLVARHGAAIIVGVDARDGLVATAGWTQAATVRATALVGQMAALGVARVIYTDIARDGTLTAPNYAATAELIVPAGPAIVASGGVGAIDHLLQLRAIGVEGVVIGRALYTGDLSFADALHALA
ncbi:MAG: 1-(5-phosphoribosyl)-5-[(5-phosphoribosylamino)methylideneamino]imidazole-4-carboxamide isomerase [Chloroflexi bacterium]|jgi:phosphoribosylformimino-5-aminoimidazole carboxamide ribotide isomerase|nr:1-(5-phosphoribosyl)-5-[(5-phosphoribosylamino)methylideneamino]imidazole-4-carboxamide isomerase [Chloroflexota bacterium]